MTTRAYTQNIIEDEHARKQIFRVLLGVLIMLSVGYLYLIGSITFNVLARKSLETNLHDVGSHVSQLDLEYLAIANTINAPLGTSLGFVDAKGTLFATRTASNVAMR